MKITGLQPLFGLTPSLYEPLIIAGPCSAESESQTLATAVRLYNDAGVKVFRAGIWKPRTKPGGFEGRGKIALNWLRKVKDTTGMLITTEIANRKHLEQALEAGIDGFWIGARTSANPFAVQEIADTLASLTHTERDNLTVLVKNPVNPDIELWIGAIERIYGAGMRRLGAIHRGFSSYGKHLYRNQPYWAIAFELIRRLPGLPLIFDPSHVAGRKDLVFPLSRQAIDMNYYGLIIESHCNPETALSDASQQITPLEMQEMMQLLERRRDSKANENLNDLRRLIDDIDDSLLELLSKRMEVARDIGEYKRHNKLPVIQMDRYRDLMEKRVRDGEKLDLSPDFVKRLLSLIHEESVRQQT